MKVSASHDSATWLSSDPHTSPHDADAASARTLYDDVSAYVTTYVTVCVFPLVHVTQMWTVWKSLTFYCSTITKIVPA